MLGDLPVSLPYFGSISSYYFMLTVAFAVAALLAKGSLFRAGLQVDATGPILMLAVAGGIIGGKLGYVLEAHEAVFMRRTLSLEKALFSWDGQVFFGGFLLAFVLIAAYLRLRHLPLLPYCDALVPLLALGYGITRLGCMLQGDGCYGQATSARIPGLTMAFGESASFPTHGVVVWNTPLIEALASFALFFYLDYLSRRSDRKPGQRFALFLIVSGAVRFLVEFLRLNDALVPIFSPPAIKTVLGTVPLTRAAAALSGYAPDYFLLHWHWYGFTQSQVVALLLVVVGAAGWLGRVAGPNAPYIIEETRCKQRAGTVL